ncbi:MAG: PQQ-binding-like beta-propeller repeat protein [Polyangiaceae bacterium]|nr:PQQ-binding-like beta-propeller repeat protein [Polyangiaceae bacterium]
MISKARLLRSFGLGAVVVLGACGGGQTQGAAFDPAQSDDGQDMARLQAIWAARPVPRGADVAVGVFGDHATVGVHITNGERWTYEHAVDCRPVIAGSVVVGSGQNEMFGLDALTGKQLWTRKAGGCIRGASDDGNVTVVSSRPVNGFGGIVVAIDRNGLVVRQVEDDSNIGAPAIVSGVLFLPWEGRFVSAYDLALGEEVARVRFTDRITHALTVGGALFFGERTFTRFDEKIVYAPIGRASTVALPDRTIPDNPPWMRSGHDVYAPRFSANDTIRLIARPESEGAPGIVGGRYVATHGRVAMAFSAKTAELSWVHSHDSTLVAGSAYEGGFALCDSEGVVTFLDAESGRTAGLSAIGVPVDVCAVQTDAFKKPLGSSVESAPPLRDQIASALALRYIDALAVQRFLVRELASLEDEAATETLIDLLMGQVTEEDLLPDVKAALASRRQGLPFMRTALAVHRDFLEGVSVRPPVIQLAQALAGARDVAAAPLLAEWLLDPDTTPLELEHVAAALEQLAGPNEVHALRTFLTVNHSEAAEPPIENALVSVARALIRLGARPDVARVSSNVYTPEPLRTKLAIVVANTPEPGASAR